MLGGATVAVFLAGKPQEGALGVFLLFAGVAMVVCPPRVAVEWRLWAVAGLFVGGSALSLLPEHFLTQPAWRRTLDAAPAVTMPGTISTSPASTVFWLAVLTLSLLTGLFSLAQPIRSRSLLIFALAGALVAGLYAALSIYAKRTGWHYPFAGEDTFGFFPNRNHTATLLFVGSLLALGVLGVVLREGRWFPALLAGASLTVCATGLIFFSTSRGGIVFLLAGIALWIAGLGALALGGGLVRAQWFGGPPLPPFAAAKAQAEIIAGFSQQNLIPELARAHAAVKESPMSMPLYYQLGTILLDFEDGETETDQAFDAGRLLDPLLPSTPQQQGEAWSSVDPKRTAALWLDAVRRCRRINRALGVAPGADAQYYADLLSKVRSLPAAQQELVNVAGLDPAFALAWLAGANPEVVAPNLPRLTAQPDLLRRFSESERARFLLGWYGKGDRAALTRFLDGHPDWQAAAWPVHLRTLTDARQFEAAVRETAARDHVSLELPAPVATAAADAEPDVPTGDPTVEFARYWRAGNTIAARRVLDEATRATGPVPAECWRIKAAPAARDLAWDQAWENLKRYLHRTQPAEVLP